MTEENGVKKTGKFTLIELLVVVAIIGILVSILMPSLHKAKERALLAVCMSNQSQISKRVFMYARDEKQNIPPYNKDGSNIDNGHNTRYFYYSGTWNTRRNLAYMWNSPDDVDFGKALFCPAMKNEIYQFKTYAPFPTANAPAWSGWSNRIRLSYNYNTWRLDDTTWEPRYKNVSMFDEDVVPTTFAGQLRHQIFVVSRPKSHSGNRDTIFQQASAKISQLRRRLWPNIGQTIGQEDHSIDALLFKWLFHFNRMAAIIGVYISNPVTMIPIYWFLYKVGTIFVAAA